MILRRNGMSLRKTFARFYDFLLRRFAPILYARKIGVNLGDGCRLLNVSFSTEPYLVTLGDHVSATATRFETHDGGVWVLRNEMPDIDVVRRIQVGNNVFFGYGSIVLPGVTIGDNVVIGAGSIVTKDIASNTIAAGCPARPIKSLAEYKEGIIPHSHNTKNLSPSLKRKFYENYFGDMK